MADQESVNMDLLQSVVKDPVINNWTKDDVEKTEENQAEENHRKQEGHSAEEGHQSNEVHKIEIRHQSEDVQRSGGVLQAEKWHRTEDEHLAEEIHQGEDINQAGEGNQLILENADETTIQKDIKQGKPKKKQSKSLARVYTRRFKRMQSKVHPLDRQPSPQLLIRNGKFEIWNPGLNNADDIGHGEIETRNIFRCCFSSKDSSKKSSRPAITLFTDEIKHIEVQFGSGVASVFQFIEWIIVHNLALFLIWTLFLMLPRAVTFNYSILKNNTLNAENIIDGNGALQELWLFYGAYEPQNSGYRFDVAYIVITMLSYFGTLFMLLRSIAKSETRLKGSPFGLLLFTSWNFSIRTEVDKNAFLVDTSIQAKDALSEAKTKEQARSRERQGIWVLLFYRALAWLISLGLTGSACFLIYFILIEVTLAEFVASNTNSKVGNDFLKNNGLSVVFSVINIVFPLLISKLVAFEAYAKVTTEIRVNVIRVFSLRFLSLIALMFTLYRSLTSNKIEGCGGTFIGREFYKIMLIDIFVVQIIRFVFKALLGLVRKEKKEPDIAALILQVVYRQALIWAGTFFCPILSLIGLLSQITVFHLNCRLVTSFCKASSKRFRNEGTTSFYKLCLVVTIAILLIPAVTVLGTSYVSIGVSPLTNSTCGPFKDKPPLEVLDEISSYRERITWLNTLYNWLTSAAVFPAFLILSTIIYVQTVRLNKQQKSFKELLFDHNKFKAKTNARFVRLGTSL